jgi:hypothetical protein
VEAVGEQVLDAHRRHEVARASQPRRRSRACP